MKISGSENLDTQLNALDAAEAYAEEELIKVWRELAIDNYQDFYEFMNREDGFECSPHQVLTAEMLMAAERGDLLRGMISMPPGHCKSTHCSHHFPAWILGRNPRHRYLQAGHSQDFVANEMGKKVRDIIGSEDYLSLFPEVSIASDQRAKDYWGLSNKKGKYVGKGVGQGISGFRGTFGGVDDPYKNRAAAESPTTRETVYQWFADDFSTRLLPGAPLFIVMTRWHSDDICGRIIEQEERREKEEAAKQERMGQEQLRKILEEKDGNRSRFKFEVVNLPAIAEDDDPLGRQPGEALWPEVYNLSELEALRAPMISSSWNSLYQGTPIDIEGGAVSTGWFGRYDKLPDRKEVKRVTMSIDTASKKNERADYTVIGTWFHDRHNNHYLVDVIRQQVEFTELCELIKKQAMRWKPDAALVENKGNGMAYLQFMEGSGTQPCPMIAIEVGQDSKEFRFDRITPMIESGNVYLPNKAPWLADYEKEIISFPMGKRDDQVDMTSQYLEWCRKKIKRGSRRLGGAKYK